MEKWLDPTSPPRPAGSVTFPLRIASLELSPELQRTVLPTDLELDLSPPPGLTRPLWRSLAGNIKDRLFPEKLPPLQISSRPVNLGMLLGEYLDLPWYRTVFTNVGDVVSPETLPPLQLESRPVDVGELLGDEISHPWWTSLLRSLADRVAPEKLPPLELSSEPVNPIIPSEAVLLTNWSNVIDGPKIFLPDKSPSTPTSAGLVLPVPPAPRPDPVQVEFVHDLEIDLRRDLRRSRLRQRFLMFVFAAEIVFLVVGRFIHR